MWRQRSRIEWSSMGDKNTFFFHQRGSKRRRRNLIRSLGAANGLMIDDTVQMEAMVVQFYKTIFRSEGVSRMQQVFDTVPVKVTDTMNVVLTASYTREEVTVALFQMFPLKSPCPDGFPAQFFQHHCDVVMLSYARLIHWAKC